MTIFEDMENTLKTVTDAVSPVIAERVPICESFGRVLAEDIASPEDVPAYSRSAFDGYAFRACDTAAATANEPAILRILEEIPAGSLPQKELSPACAVKILTGAPLPDGADAVIKHEETDFSGSEVRIFRSVSSGAGILPAGSDLKLGERALSRGCVIGAAETAVLAALGYASVPVFRRPKIGIAATGSELVEIDAPLHPGKLRDSNPYMIAAACAALGCETEILGIAADTAEDIAGLIFIGLSECDMVITSGGVSAGDYDLTPDAIEMAGGTLLFRRPSSMPGGACAYGVGTDGKLVCALSGSPGAALINFMTFAAAAVKKLSGREDYLPKTAALPLASAAKMRRREGLVPGTLDFSEGKLSVSLPDRRISPLARLPGVTVLVSVPAGEGEIPAGTALTCLLP